jgi:hypothetical protein
MGPTRIGWAIGLPAGSVSNACHSTSTAYRPGSERVNSIKGRNGKFLLKDAPRSRALVYATRSVIRSPSRRHSSGSRPIHDLLKTGFDPDFRSVLDAGGLLMEAARVSKRLGLLTGCGKKPIRM